MGYPFPGDPTSCKSMVILRDFPQTNPEQIVHWVRPGVINFKPFLCLKRGPSTSPRVRDPALKSSQLVARGSEPPGHAEACSISLDEITGNVAQAQAVLLGVVVVVVSCCSYIQNNTIGIK